MVYGRHKQNMRKNEWKFSTSNPHNMLPSFSRQTKATELRHAPLISLIFPTQIRLAAAGESIQATEGGRRGHTEWIVYNRVGRLEDIRVERR